MQEVKVEYWYNKAIEKYLFKFWFKPEKAWIGTSGKTLEAGLKNLEDRWPDIKFNLECIDK